MKRKSPAAAPATEAASFCTSRSEKKTKTNFGDNKLMFALFFTPHTPVRQLDSLVTYLLSVFLNFFLTRAALLSP